MINKSTHIIHYPFLKYPIFCHINLFKKKTESRYSETSRQIHQIKLEFYVNLSDCFRRILPKLCFCLKSNMLPDYLFPGS